MSLPRRLAAASALFVLAMSVFAVPACEVDSTGRPHEGRPETTQRPTAPGSTTTPAVVG